MSHTTTGYLPGDGRTATLTETQRYRLFSAKRRRIVLELLPNEESPVDLEDLAARVTARDGSLDSDDQNDIERVKVTLHHTHLPKMDSLGVLDYDYESKRVRF